MLKQNQKDAIKKLEQALLSCKRAGMAIVGCDDSLLITVADDDLVESSARDSTVEAILRRANYEDTAWKVKSYGVYRDSGAT
ncbi:hypothetical protein [Pseudomonas sp. EMN2]|uniref:hypothetical protein n=1 Tax=Pseudomonas sp. EMN2 TaxID=2615212 RepID=UPI00129B9658|nr:hypothetical protein [Pseudomonas sp. EMN2]